MTHSHFPWIIAGVVGSGTVLAAASYLMSPRASSARTPPAVYVCRESGEIFVGRGELVPQIHPGTGRATVWPGVYCEQCQTWKPAPPMEKLHRQPELLNCPVCKSRRSFTGQVPDDVEEL